MEKKKRRYVPPSINAISIQRASGQGGIEGTCTSGQYPYPICNEGLFVQSPGCNPAGNEPNTGKSCLLVGTGATNTCTSGTAPG